MRIILVSVPGISFSLLCLVPLGQNHGCYGKKVLSTLGLLLQWPCPLLGSGAASALLCSHFLAIPGHMQHTYLWGLPEAKAVVTTSYGLAPERKHKTTRSGW